MSKLNNWFKNNLAEKDSKHKIIDTSETSIDESIESIISWLETIQKD